MGDDFLSFRPVVECAEKWQMEPVLWMFDGSHADVDSDCKLIVELRTTLHEKTKLMAKVIAHCDGGDDNAVLDAQQQRGLEMEVQRLVMLSPDEIDRRLRTELDYMPPTSKAMTSGPPHELPQGPAFETPARGAFAKSLPVPPLPGGTGTNKMGHESSASPPMSIWRHVWIVVWC